MEDDWYNGMFIPKVSLMIPNVWHLNHDPEIYAADTAHSTLQPGEVLGRGRRVDTARTRKRKRKVTSRTVSGGVCVGKHVANLANKSLFIDFAMMLWACTIEPGKDENGKVIPIDMDGCIEDSLVVWVPLCICQLLDFD